MWLFVGFTLVIVLYLCYLLRRRMDWFNNTDVNHFKPQILFGNMTRFLANKKHLGDLVQEVYDAFPNDRFVGFYHMMQPVVVLKDLELITQIAARKFDHFTDRFVAVSEEADSYMGGSLPFMKGEKWRQMRTTLNPAFSQTKMGRMCPMFSKCAKQMIDYIKTLNTNGSILEINCENLQRRYVTNVLASTCFGVQVNTFSQDGEEFFQMCHTITNLDFKTFLKIAVSLICLPLLKILGIEMLDPKGKSYMQKAIRKSMEERERNNIYQADFVQILMEVMKGTLKHEDDENYLSEENFQSKMMEKIRIAGSKIQDQGVAFLFAGIDTGSSTLSFFFHEMAENPEIQAKLSEEIRHTRMAFGDDVTFDNINSMKYLDMALSESMRKWPQTLATVDRICTKDFELGPPRHDSELNYKMTVGGVVWIPLVGIHRDPKYWSDPERFDPERFSAENKPNIVPHSYMPFGIGPRKCIGVAFAILMVKVAIYQMMSEFEFLPPKRHNGKQGYEPAALTLKPRLKYIAVKPRF